MHRKALGKGLEALFSTPVETTTSDDDAGSRRIISIPIRDIVPNSQQPRESFDEEAMADLKASIAENGILEPPIVRRKGELFELIAGERRFRAAKELNYDTLEVILMDVDSEERMLVWSLIENIQRENLNAIEEAKAYHHILESMGITQDEMSRMVGKSRSTIANTLRLLNLSNMVQEMVSDGSLASGSARALIPVTNEAVQLTLARTIAKQGLSTRKAEALVKQALNGNLQKKKTAAVLPPDVEQIRVELQHILGSEVRIKGDGSKGKIEIPYFSDEDLARILESIGGHTSS